MAKIDMEVAIRDPKEIYRPNDVFEGEITLINNDRNKDGSVKPTKVKSVQVQFFEHVAVASNEIGTCAYFLDESHEDVKGKMVGKAIDVNSWVGVELNAEPVTLPFSVRVPGGYHSNLGRQPAPYNKDWFVGVAIHQKTGLIGVPNFVRIFPVDGSDRASNLLNSVRVIGTPQASAPAPVAVPMPVAYSPAPAQTGGMFGKINVRGALGGLNINIGGGNAPPVAVASPVVNLPPPVRVAGTVKRPGADFGKIAMAVAIYNQKPVYRPGELLEGEITLLNKQREKDGEVKPATVKTVEVYFWEHVPVGEKELGTFSIHLDYGDADPLKGKPVGRSIPVDAWNGVELGAEPVTLPFSVQVPGGYHSNLGRQPVPYNKDWFVGVAILQKTGMMPTPGFSRILPVDGSDRESDLFNDLEPLKGSTAVQSQFQQQQQAQYTSQPSVAPSTITPQIETPIAAAYEQPVIVAQENTNPRLEIDLPIAPMVPITAVFIYDDQTDTAVTSMVAPESWVATSTPETEIFPVSSAMSPGQIEPPTVAMAGQEQVTPLKHASAVSLFQATEEISQVSPMLPILPILPIALSTNKQSNLDAEISSGLDEPVILEVNGVKAVENIPHMKPVPAPSGSLAKPFAMKPVPTPLTMKEKPREVAFAPVPFMLANPVAKFDFSPEAMPVLIVPAPIVSKGQDTRGKTSASSIDYHAKCLSLWGKGVPIPIYEIAKIFDLELAQVMKLINTWIEKAIPLKFDGIEKTVTLGG